MKFAPELIVAGVMALSAPATADSTVPVTSSAAAVHDAKYDLAVRLLKDTGAADAMASNIQSGVEAGIEEQRKAHPEISDAFWALSATYFAF